MNPATAIQLILGGLQVINTARRMFDPTGGDPLVGNIIARSASGEISLADAEQQLRERAKQRVNEEMDEWRSLAPKT